MIDRLKLQYGTHFKLHDTILLGSLPFWM